MVRDLFRDFAFEVTSVEIESQMFDNPACDWSPQGRLVQFREILTAEEGYIWREFEQNSLIRFIPYVLQPTAKPGPEIGMP